MAHTPLKMTVEEAHAEVKYGWAHSYSPEALAQAVASLDHERLGYRVNIFLARLCFRGIYFPMLGKLSWLRDPNWIRGRMNATHMMVSQGGMALAGLLWGGLATAFGLSWALFLASALGIVSALAAKRLSIDFSKGINLESDPLGIDPPNLYMPEPDGGPITTAMEIEVAPQNQVRFFRLIKELRLVFLRNGAFSARVDQDMDNPNRFRLQAMYSSWAAVERLDRRITRDEHTLWSEIWTLHTGPDLPRPKRHLGIQHWIPEEAAISRLKPVPKPSEPEQ